MPTLYLTRPGVAPQLPVLGHIVRVPPAPSAKRLAERDIALDSVLAAAAVGDDALMACLGHEALLAGVGRPDRLELVGLHEPTPWEQRFVTWAARWCGTELPATWLAPRPMGPFTEMATALADVLVAWPAQPPAGTRLVSGGSSALEALGIVRLLRQTVLATDPASRPEACDAWLVLLPHDAGRLQVWSRELERHGLPARVQETLALGDTSIGRWLLALCELGDWSVRPLERDTLQAALLSPMLVLGEHVRRSDLRALLRGLRRPSVTLAEWQAHVAGHFEALIADRKRKDIDDIETQLGDLAERRQAILDRIAGIVAGLGSTRAPGFWRRLASVLGNGGDGLKTGQRVRAAERWFGDLLERCRGVLDMLEESDAGGEDGNRKQALRQALAGQRMRMGSRLAHGVRVQTYATWDGIGAACVVLSGLEEGSYPQAPASLSRADQVLHEALLGLTPSLELARLAQVAALAAAHARTGLILSWSTTDTRGSDTFPGALLAGRPETPQWQPQRVDERDVVPVSIGQASAPEDLLLFAVPAYASDQIDAEFARNWTTAQEVAAAAAGVDSARKGSGERAAFGPFTGKVGVPLTATSYSPTSLETLGECGTKYLFQRVLKASRADDAASDLDASETGSMLHAAFANAAQNAIRSSDAWSLSIPPGADRVLWLQDRRAELAGTLDEEVKRLTRQHPTLSGALLDATVSRWLATLERELDVEAGAATGGRFESGPMPAVADLPAELLQELAAKADTKVGREAIQNVLKKRQKTEAFMALVQRASNMTFAKKVDAERWYGEQDKDAQGTTIAKFVAAAMAATADAWQPLLAQSTVDLEKATLAAQPVLAHAFREDRLAVPRDVLAAEWQFGQKRRDDDGADARSVEAPLALRLSEDQSILVHGRVDRVDGDRARGDTAVADYKSGKSKTVSKLEGEFGAGVHLQLPLYGAAVEQLFVPVHVGPSARVDVGRLQFVRHAKEARLWLAADSETWQSAAGGDHVSTPDVLHAHLRHSLRRLDQGIVPLLPRRCPALHRDAYCDFAGICGVSAAPHHAFSDPDPQPKFVRPASARHGETPKPDEARPPERLELSQETPDAEAADQAQKQALLDALRLDSDVVVSAGAGAGKTYVLVQRYVAALASGCSPDAVLAITFTRKATAEMRSRARQELLLRRKEFAHADAFRASILGIGSAPILTIDAFAARLVQSYRDDELQVVDDLRGYRQRWVDARLITAAEAGEPDAQALLAAWPVKQVREVLEDLLAHPEGLAASTRLDRRGLLAAWEEHLGRALPDWRADLAKLRTVSSGFQAAVAETIPANQDALAQLHGAVRDACTAADSLGAIGFLWGIRQCPGKTNKFSEEGEKAKAELRTLRQRYVDADAPTKSLADRMNQFETAEALREAVAEEAATTATALRIAIAWHAELKEYLARHHLAGFDDVLARAVALVEDPQLDAKDFATRFPFLHMLVDEFQDTNGEQVRLIEAVRRVLERAGHKAHLFLVGDPKQSIYRFRGAEVDVFERELARHEDGRVHVQLPVGRRARPALTRALDRLFERIFAGRTSATTLADPLATVPWQPLAPRWKELEIERKHDDDGLPCIELLKMSDEEAEAAAKIAARAALDADEESDRESPNVDPLDQVVAARLAELWATWPVKSDGKSPIALLTHSWARAQHWGKVLQKYGIPAFVQGGHGLLGTNEVRALLNVLDALEAEDDDIAWLGILRGPLTAVSDPTLYCLRRGFGLQLKKFNSPDAWLAAEDGRRLSVLRHGFQFDAAAALAGLEQQKGSPLDADVQAAVLADEVRLKRLAEWWPKVARTYGLVALADTVRMLLEYSHLQPIQHAAGGQEGLRALANVRSFLSLVDQVSDAPGRMPATPCASCVDYARRETIPRQAVATCSQAWRSRSRSCIRPRAWSGTWSCCQTCTGRRSRHA